MGILEDDVYPSSHRNLSADLREIEDKLNDGSGGVDVHNHHNCCECLVVTGCLRN